MKLKYAFTTVIVTFAVAMVVSLVSIVMMNVDTYKFNMDMDRFKRFSFVGPEVNSIGANLKYLRLSLIHI